MVSLSAQADPDFLRFDGLEAVTVQLVGAANKNQEIPVSHALPRPIDIRRDTLLGIELATDSKVWNIRKSDLQGAELRENDLIIDGSGNKWKVVSLSLRTFSTRYRAVCNKLRSNT